MSKNTKLIILIVILFAAAIGVFFMSQSSGSQANLQVSNDSATSTTSTDVTGDNSIAQSFVTLLLSVKNLKLDDKIFSNPAFISLHDSSVTLTPDITVGRPDPFAPFGSDSVVSTPVNTTTPPTTPTTSGSEPPPTI